MEILAYIGITLLLLLELVVITIVNSSILRGVDKADDIIDKVLHWTLLFSFILSQVAIFTFTMGFYRMV